MSQRVRHGLVTEHYQHHLGNLNLGAVPVMHSLSLQRGWVFFAVVSFAFFFLAVLGLSFGTQYL